MKHLTVVISFSMSYYLKEYLELSKTRKIIFFSSCTRSFLRIEIQNFVRNQQTWVSEYFEFSGIKALLLQELLSSALVSHFWNSPTHVPTQEWQTTFSEAEFHWKEFHCFRIQILILNENAGQVHVHLPYFSVLITIYQPRIEIYKILHPCHLTLKQKWKIKHPSDNSGIFFPCCISSPKLF